MDFIAIRIFIIQPLTREDTKKRHFTDLNAHFLAGFTAGGVFDFFAQLYRTAGNSPHLIIRTHEH